ncbi:hypothetical protein J2752_000497 [Halarchaeum rubridurum]|uniref:Uncharacterized protein n=1 Tax=Halarchaeum rubridurum TaxID=489911 RepID=A0A830FYT6_9EURY|nr:hypothetical protein [Halarchaeum rubridurum]MBP1953616.1 hypothetical protein [Halarchaeum rubridurum]GGM63902.1 hypothetical protein GCM10009017_12480 [Halarchaeum rubridurum]
MSDTEQSPFEPLETEIQNDRVRCPGCGDAIRCRDAVMSLDKADRTDDGVVVNISREYPCSEDCALSVITGEVSADTDRGGEGE